MTEPDYPGCHGEEEEQAEAAMEAEAARIAKIETTAREVLGDPALIHKVGLATEARGVAGERANSQVLYMAIASQLTDEPISVLVKGDSSGGKSSMLKKTIDLFPEGRVTELTAMSEKALIHDRRDHSHRTIVLYENEGQGDGFLAYIIRSLISEGRIVYATSVKEGDAWKAKTIERKGPTNFISTTTMAQVHAENETRVWSLLVDDSPANTKKVLAMTAKEAEGRAPQPDASPWRDTFEWLASEGTQRAVVPFASHLAAAIPNHAVRVRRDFRRFLRLIEVSAILHQLQRQHDADGNVIAEAADYAIARELSSAAMKRAAEGIDQRTLDIVAAVRQAIEWKVEADFKIGVPSVNYGEIDEFLRRGRPFISRWIEPAIRAEMLINSRRGQGLEARVRLGGTPATSDEVLPDADWLAAQLDAEFEWVHPVTGEVVRSRPPTQPPPETEPPIDEDAPANADAIQTGTPVLSVAPESNSQGENHD